MKKKKLDQDLKIGARTDIGKVRKQNEDSLLAQAPIFAVADGMGGHAAGEVASEIAINTLRENAPRTADADALADAVKDANNEVIKAAIEGKGKEGMGTTMTAAVIEGNSLCIAQVGDSRAYLLHSGNLQQITRDHSLMADLIEQGQITPAEARVHPNRSLITRALGNDPDMFADQYELDIEEGDRLLLCSDGLCGVLTDEIILTIMNECQDPQICADQLVDRANMMGGPDNITVIVVDICGSVVKKRKKIRKSKRTFVLIIILFVAIIAGAIALGSYIIGNSAYLCEEEGFISVYQGIPGNFCGINFSKKIYGSDVYVNDLRETTRDHFKDGIIKVEGLDAANRAIENYRKEADTMKEQKSKASQPLSQPGNTDQKKATN